MDLIAAIIGIASTVSHVGAGDLRSQPGRSSTLVSEADVTIKESERLREKFHPPPQLRS